MSSLLHKITTQSFPNSQKSNNPADINLYYYQIMNDKGEKFRLLVVWQNCCFREIDLRFFRSNSESSMYVIRLDNQKPH